MTDVQLRDVDDADLEVFFEQQREEEAVRRARFPARDREHFLTHWRTKVLGNPTGHALTVTVDGQVAGNIVAWWQDGRRFVGYWFGQRFWGRGIGTAAVRQFLQREQNRPLHADVFAGNTASVRLLERCGFQRVGVEHDGDLEFVALRLDDGAAHEERPQSVV
ncbi:GNAT family N-acetyltransferase [Catellatospora citrea]|uniref:GNAT family N-acetyltransferase n=1 Tax=Catellatospora citrea TaxID=53366 RepID=UPI0033EF8A70